MTGNDAVNLLSGLDGDDSLKGEGGNDTLNGGNGADLLDGGAGADSMAGGTGDDVYVVDAAADRAVEAANAGIDLIRSSITRTLDANVENLELTVASAINGTGNALANTITGNAAANVVSGLGGSDQLFGGAGNDTLNGGDGVDVLVGGLGVNRLVGDAALDYFTFNDAARIAAANADVIEDLSGADDYIALFDGVFGDLRAAPGGNAMDARFFRLGSAASDADDRIICNSATGAVLFDPDGAGGAAAIRFATVDAGLVLRPIDFYIF